MSYHIQLQHLEIDHFNFIIILFSFPHFSSHFFFNLKWKNLTSLSAKILISQLLLWLKLFSQLKLHVSNINLSMYNLPFFFFILLKILNFLHILPFFFGFNILKHPWGSNHDLTFKWMRQYYLSYKLVVPCIIYI